MLLAAGQKNLLKNPQKTILIDRKLKFQPYIVDVRSIAVFTPNFINGAWRTRAAFQDSVLTFED